MKNLQLLLVVLVVAGLQAASGPDRIVGTWVTAEGLSKIDIAKCGEKYCGTIAWMKSPHNDEKNEDPGKRGRALVGTQILSGFKYDGGDTYSGGSIYGPERGKTVKAKLELSGDGTLQIHAGSGIAKKTVTWTRQK